MDKRKDLTFGEAVAALKEDKKVKRAIWDGYWFMAPKNTSFSFDRNNEGYIGSFAFNSGIVVAVLKDGGGCAPAQPYQSDWLAEDWQIVD